MWLNTNADIFQVTKSSAAPSPTITLTNTWGGPWNSNHHPPWWTSWLTPGGNPVTVTDTIGLGPVTVYSPSKCAIMPQFCSPTDNSPSLYHHHCEWNRHGCRWQLCCDCHRACSYPQHSSWSPRGTWPASTYLKFVFLGKVLLSFIKGKGQDAVVMFDIMFRKRWCRLRDQGYQRRSPWS